MDSSKYTFIYARWAGCLDLSLCKVIKVHCCFASNPVYVYVDICLIILFHDRRMPITYVFCNVADYIHFRLCIWVSWTTGEAWVWGRHFGWTRGAEVEFWLFWAAGSDWSICEWSIDRRFILQQIGRWTSWALPGRLSHDSQPWRCRRGRISVWQRISICLEGSYHFQYVYALNCFIGIVWVSMMSKHARWVEGHN